MPKKYVSCCGDGPCGEGSREIQKGKEGDRFSLPESQQHIDPHLIQQSSAPPEIPIMHGCYFGRQQADRRLPMPTPSILFDFNSRMR